MVKLVAGSKADHRERLIEAMVAVAARHGYGGASVARVVAQAGVSRATFYEHFSTKEECFAATYRALAEDVRSHLAGIERGVDGDDLTRYAVGQLLSGAESRPAAVRVVLIEALAASRGVRAEHEELLRSIDDFIERRLRHPSPDLRIEIPPRALLGGLINVISIRVYRGETDRFVDLLDDLVAWIGSYATVAAGVRIDWTALVRQLARPEPEPADTGNRPTKGLPRGRGAVPRVVVVGDRRQRIVGAVASLMRTKGYAETTVADIVSAAGIAREAFYRQFPNKEEAFLAAQATALQESIAFAASAFFTGEAWPDRVWNGLAAMLGYVSRHPDLVAVDVIETYAAGPAAMRRSFDNRAAYGLFLEDGYRQDPRAERLPRLCTEAVAGAILELLRGQAVQGKATRSLDLLPQATYVALAPFVGVERAAELVKQRCRRPRGRSPEFRDEG